MFKLNLYNQEGKELKHVELDKNIFDGSVNTAVIYQAVNIYQANARRGLAATKTRGEVSGGGKKPWAQKGTGRARHGSIRSPLWRKGGVVFGPHPRDFSKGLPKRIRKSALISSINAKLKDNNVMLLEKIEFNSAKTKEAHNLFKKLKLIGSSILVIVNKKTDNLERVIRNIKGVTLIEPDKLNAQIILENKKIIVVEDALKALLKFIKNESI
ncbi:MAG: 50S ribosomal protein L4 [Candidatus Omnitrophota bacterium]